MSEKKKEFMRAVKFTLFSISAGLIQIISFTLLNEFTGLSYWVAYLISLVLSVVWNFTLNRQYTFKSANNVPVAMFKVFLFYLVFTPLSTLLERYIVDTLHWSEYIATGINMILNIVLEYLYDRFFVFKDSIDTNKMAQKEK